MSAGGFHQQSTLDISDSFLAYVWPFSLFISGVNLPPLIYSMVGWPFYPLSFRTTRHLTAAFPIDDLNPERSEVRCALSREILSVIFGPCIFLVVLRLWTGITFDYLGQSNRPFADIISRSFRGQLILTVVWILSYCPFRLNAMWSWLVLQHINFHWHA
jgi:hypothetical protein